MATYKILYWQEVPSQIKAEDDEDEVTVPNARRSFMERIDHLAVQRGLQGSDDYLAAMAVERGRGTRGLGARSEPKRC